MGVSDALKNIGLRALPTMAHAAVAELADALDSKSSGSPRAGSSPASGIATTLVITDHRSCFAFKGFLK